MKTAEIVYILRCLMWIDDKPFKNCDNCKFLTSCRDIASTFDRQEPCQTP